MRLDGQAAPRAILVRPCGRCWICPFAELPRLPLLPAVRASERSQARPLCQRLLGDGRGAEVPRRNTQSNPLPQVREVPLLQCRRQARRRPRSRGLSSGRGREKGKVKASRSPAMRLFRTTCITPTCQNPGKPTSARRFEGWAERSCRPIK